MTNLQRYKDIDLSFEPHPSTGDLITLRDDIAIKNSVKNLVLTKHYERPFHSEIGSNVNKMLFENANPGIVTLLRQEIIDVINNFEPRVIVEDVQVLFSPDFNEIKVTIVFTIRNTMRPMTVQFTLNRTR